MTGRNDSEDGSGRGRPAGRAVDQVREVPEEELREVVRLDTPGEEERLDKWDRSGIGVDGGEGESGAALPDEEGREEIEPVDVEQTWDKGAHHSPMGLIVLAGVLGALVLALAMWRIPKGDVLVEEKASALAAKLDEEAQSMQDAGVLMKHIEVVVRQYLEAETVEEKLRFVRHRERVKPLMEEYYRTHPVAPRSYEKVTAFYPVGVENEPFLFMQVRSEEGTLIPLLVEQVGERDLRVDWETDVAYQPMPMQEFLEKQPEEPVDFRVFVQKDTHYTHEFRDEDRYQCLMLTERDSDAYLFGYVERGTEVHRKVIELLGEEKPPRREPMLLKVRRLPDSQTQRSVLVEEVVAERWALVEPRNEGD